MDKLEQDPAFEEFLGASVGTDQHGVNVTVLSMLARLDVDPWIEAAELTAMPDGPAHKRLDSLMARFHDVPALMADRGKTISALLAFLPRKNKPTQTMSFSGAIMSQGPVVSPSLYWIISAAFIVGWIVYLTQAQ
jgi:hypothetical protein